MIVETLLEKQTFDLGFDMGKNAKPGEIYVLNGDLGVGKTVFTKGFAKGLLIDEHISSPTFNIVNEYSSGRMPLYHFDVYRITHIEEMEEIGYEEYFFSKGVCLIEWGKLIKELLPINTTYITIEKNLKKGFEYRKITIDNQETL